MKRFDYLFRRAWFSVAKERGYVYDAFLGTASHITIARLSVKGL